MQGIKSFFKTVWNNTAIAFSMFSRIPVPYRLVDWRPENMRYMMCAFPFVGVFEAFFCFLILWFGSFFSCNQLFLAAALTIAPLIVSGGVHLDGYCDTSDALSSQAPREKKIAILKDPHCGAFAVIAVVCYLLLYFAVNAGLLFTKDQLVCYFAMPVFARALSGLAVATFPCAKDTGLAKTFSDAAQKKRVRGFEIVLLILLGTGMLFFAWKDGLVCITAALLCFWRYYAVQKKQFGGITGDLAGWFVQKAMLYALIGLYLLQLIGGKFSWY